MGSGCCPAKHKEDIMMKARKLVSTLLAGVMVLSLAACGSSNSGTTASGGSTSAGSSTATTATPSTDSSAAATTTDGAGITLNMWCIATESDSNRHSYEAAIADMKANHPDITFN